MREIRYAGLLFLLVVLTALPSCKNQPVNNETVEDQVRKSYEQFILLMDAGVNPLMVLRLEGDNVEGEITKPTDADMEEYMVLYEQEPLCSGLNSREEIVACLVNVLKEKGCVRMIMCADCIYSCAQE